MHSNRVQVFFCSFILAVFCLSGCVPVLIGTGIVTGYLVTKDSVSGNLENSFENIWSTSLQVVNDKAEIIDQNRDAGLIKAKRGKDSITVKITELTEHSYNLRVKSRKALAIANLSLAQEVFTAIVRNLNVVYKD